MNFIILNFVIVILLIPHSFEAPFMPVSKLIYEFLLDKYLHAVTMFVCWKTENLISFSQHLMSKRISVNMMNRFDVPLDNILKIGKRSAYEAVVLDGDCIEAQELLKGANDRLFDATYHWLILDTSGINKMEMILRNSSLNINTAITLVTTNIVGKKYNLYEIYNPSSQFGGKMKINLLGTWSFYNKFSWTNYALENKLERRRNMSGVELQSQVVVTAEKVATKTELLDYLGSYKNLDHDLLTRYEYKLLLPLQFFLNLSINYTQTKSWGYKQDNGSFDGAIGSMNKGEAELSASATNYNIVRFPYIEATAKILDFKQCFIFLHPEDTGLSTTEAFFRPYTTGVWLAATSCAFLLLLLLRFTSNYELIFREHTWSSAVVILIGAISQQGTTWSPKRASGRILLLYMLLFTMMFYQFYSAILVSTLLMDPPRSITDMKSLLESNLEVEIEDIIYLRNYFKTIDFGYGLEIRKRKIENKQSSAFVKPLSGINNVQAGGVAYIGDIAKAHMMVRSTFTDKQICKLQEIDLMDPWQMYLILRKGSTFKKIMTFGLRRIIESGIMNRELIIWDVKTPECVVTRTGEDISVNLAQAAMPFLILGAGFIIAVFIFLIEQLWHLRSLYVRRK